MYLYFFIVLCNLSQSFIRYKSIFTAIIIANNRRRAAHLMIYNNKIREAKIQEKIANQKLN